MVEIEGRKLSTFLPVQKKSPAKVKILPFPPVLACSKLDISSSTSSYPIRLIAMISSLVWVRRGAAASHPQRFNITDEAELQRVQKLTSLEFGDAQAQLELAKKEALQMGVEDEWEEDNDGEEMEDGDDKAADDEAIKPDTAMDPVDKTADTDDLAKYNLDEYDDEQSKGIAMGAFSNIKGLQFYKTNDDDPYITMKDNQDDEEEEREALEILPSDNLVITAKTEDEVSLIEAHVYATQTDKEDEAEGSRSSVYVHHDLLLPSFPLCLEWVGQSGSSKGNFLAVSTMEPEVEIWNMDVIDGLVPDIVLGDRAASKEWEKQSKKVGTGKKKKRILATRPTSPLYHTDAVLSISWNPFVPNLLVTSSADTTIKLWDLNATPAEHGGINAIRSFEIHQDKVQSVAWNTSGIADPSNSTNTERSLIASGGYDGFVKVWDVRMPEQVSSIKVAGEVEKLRWDPWKPNHLLVALDSGLVQSYDVTKLKGGPIWTLSAHESACTSVDMSLHLPGCLMTAGLDRVVKLWNLVEEGGKTKPKEISLVVSRDVGAGKIFSASFSPDEPLTIAAAGSSGSVKIWDALAAKGVAPIFGDRLKEWAKRNGEEERKIKEGQDALVEVEEDEGDDDDDEEEDAAGEETNPAEAADAMEE